MPVAKRIEKTTMAISIFAMIFGTLTIISGGFALFAGEVGRQFAGNYVPFVLWFNFISGFFYIAAGLGLLLGKSWALVLVKLLMASILVVFIGFLVFALTGAAYELRTVGAMTLRLTFWTVAFFQLRK